MLVENVEPTEQELGTRGPPRECWTTASIIPHHWPCWLMLMGIVVQQHLEDSMLVTPGLNHLELAKKPCQQHDLPR